MAIESGFFLPPPQIPGWHIWLHYIDPVGYATARPSLFLSSVHVFEMLTGCTAQLTATMTRLDEYSSGVRCLMLSNVIST